MHGFVSEKFKVLLESGVLEHRHGIPANQEHFAFLDFVVGVKSENPWGGVHGSFVFHSLTIIFTIRLKIGKFEKPVSGGDEFNSITFLLNIFVLDSDLRIFDKSWVRESTFLGQSFEIVPIKGARETFTKKDWVLSEMSGDSFAGVNIRKIELTAWFEYSECFSKDSLFVHG